MSYPRRTLYGTLYRWLMTLAHRYNWHHTHTIYPGGDTLIVCDWCGLRYVKYRTYSGYEPISADSDTGTDAAIEQPKEK